MSVNKKRFSQGNSLVNIPLEENDEDFEGSLSMDTPIGGRRSFGRRRSSFGGVLSASKSPQKSAEEQARVAEMYKTVIKMSAENKINEKNSWSFDLIDHMGKFIREEGRAVNFQKASCTLDASVKIYSHRVDDTHASTHRILESFSRNGNSGNDDADPDARGSAKVGSKTASNRLNIAETLEKKLENINAGTIESSLSGDPLFQKMSKAFDEGGAKGMLMYNMRVLHESSCMSFCTDSLDLDCVEKGKDTEATTFADVVDISELIFKSQLNWQELSTMLVCPELDDYRSTVGVVSAPELFDASVMSVNGMPVDGGSHSDDNRTVSPAPRVETDFVSVSHDVVDDDDFDDSNDGGAYFADDDNGADGGDEPEGNGYSNDLAALTASPAVALAIRRSSMGPQQTKIHWESVFDEVPAGAALAAGLAMDSGHGSVCEGTHGQYLNQSPNCDGEPILSALDELVSSGANDYSYFNFASMDKSNAWAGARHWKFALRSRAPKTIGQDSAAGNSNNEEDAPLGITGDDDEQVQAGAAAAPSKASKKTKSKFSIDFSSPLGDEDAFAIPLKGRTDPTILTDAAQEKSSEAASSFMLPPDAKLQAKDLCRLFLCPSIIVPPRELFAMLSLADVAKNTNVTHGNAPAQRERIWGHGPLATAAAGRMREGLRLPSTPAGTGAGRAGGDEEYYYNDDDDGDVDYGGCDDAGGDDGTGDGLRGGRGGANASSAPDDDTTTGLEINTDALLKASRTVQKVVVGYATKTAKVNVRKLKSDIWSHIDAQLVAPSHATKKMDDSSFNSSFGDENLAPRVNASLDLSCEGSGSLHTTTESLSFKELMSGVEAGQQQTGVSLPFYFICLLHLANEKNLDIQSVATLSDLIISKDV